MADELLKSCEQAADRFEAATGHRDVFLPLPVSYNREAHLRLPCALLREDVDDIMRVLQDLRPVLEMMVLPSEKSIRKERHRRASDDDGIPWPGDSGGKCPEAKP